MIVATGNFTEYLFGNMERAEYLVIPEPLLIRDEDTTRFPKKVV